MMARPIILIGGGGHCASCIDAIESCGEWVIIGIVDLKGKCEDSILGYKMIGSDEDMPALAGVFGNALVTIGQIKSSGLRERLFEAAKAAGFSLPTIVASTAWISRHANAGAGTAILHHAFVNARAAIGENCIINSGALVEHDTIVGPHTHVSTNAVVNGACRIGARCFIGSGSVIRNGVHISDSVIVGAGAVVVNDLLEPGTYLGSPARKKA
jgi:sugar O-acyltransferase (sialic acid O-acetyltransferase NeuD family)